LVSWTHQTMTQDCSLICEKYLYVLPELDLILWMDSYPFLSWTSVEVSPSDAEEPFRVPVGDKLLVCGANGQSV
jgi:hypothetical protein